MINFYKTENCKIVEIAVPEKNCWIAAHSPNENEIDYLINHVGVAVSFISSAMDNEEYSHIEKEDDQTLIIVDTPVEEKAEDANTAFYYTVPMSFVVMNDYVVTITQEPSFILGEIAANRIKNINTAHKTNFLFRVLYSIATKYIFYLRQIDKITEQSERRLQKSMKNQEIIQLLNLQKSLVYFSTSLKAVESTLNKILRGKTITLYADDEDLLEDTLIEIKQAIETAKIYTGILAGTMDAFGSVISNNLNIVMKVMTSITIVMAIPNIIFGFYGMNVELPLAHVAAPIGITFLLMSLVAIWLYKKGFF